MLPKFHMYVACLYAKLIKPEITYGELLDVCSGAFAFDVDGCISRAINGNGRGNIVYHVANALEFARNEGLDNLARIGAITHPVVDMIASLADGRYEGLTAEEMIRNRIIEKELPQGYIDLKELTEKVIQREVEHIHPDKVFDSYPQRGAGDLWVMEQDPILNDMYLETKERVIKLMSTSCPDLGGIESCVEDWFNVSHDYRDIDGVMKILSYRFSIEDGDHPNAKELRRKILTSKEQDEEYFSLMIFATLDILKRMEPVLI